MQWPLPRWYLSAKCTGRLLLRTIHIHFYRSLLWQRPTNFDPSFWPSTLSLLKCPFSTLQTLFDCPISQISHFSLLDRPVLSALAFILLGSFIDWGQNRFLSGLRRPSVRKTQIKSDSDRLIYKKNSFPPYMSHVTWPSTVFWTVQLNPNGLWTLS